MTAQLTFLHDSVSPNDVDSPAARKYNCIVSKCVTRPAPAHGILPRRALELISDVAINSLVTEFFQPLNESQGFDDSVDR